MPATPTGRCVEIASGRPDGERERVRRAQSGEPGAFEALYRAHAGRVYALCLRLTGERTLAEELTQDAFVRAWQRLSSFRGDSAFSTWLHRLTVNVVVSYLRARAGERRHEVLVDDFSALDRPAVSSHPGTGIDLERALKTLPQGARTVFVLHDVEGWRHEEIARAAGIAVGTSKAQLHRARALLREVLR